MRAPLIVNLGMGVDSVAMLVGMRRRGERPDLIMFADTGSEKPETVAYLDVIREWLARVGFPDVTVARRPVARAGYATLEENCLVNETLPSLAFGFKSCSLKWKAEAMDRFLLGVKRGPNKCPGWAPALEALAAGIKPVKCIGYDNGPKDSRRATNRVEDDHFIYRYPLREWDWDRERCIDEIRAAGLPVPVKSACFFCPASKPWELLWLAARHPELFLRAIRMEDNARDGKNGLDKVKGLWGRDTKDRGDGKRGCGSWRAWAEAEGILAGNEIVMDPAELMERAAAAKPLKEANDCSLVQIGRKVSA